MTAKTTLGCPDCGRLDGHEHALSCPRRVRCHCCGEYVAAGPTFRVPGSAFGVLCSTCAWEQL